MKTIIAFILLTASLSVSGCAAIQRSWQYNQRCEKVCVDWGLTVDPIYETHWMYDGKTKMCICELKQEVYIVPPK